MSVSHREGHGHAKRAAGGRGRQPPPALQVPGLAGDGVTRTLPSGVLHLTDESLGLVSRDAA